MFCLRLNDRDQRNLADIINLDADLPNGNQAGARTEAVRAALREYAKKLRRRV